MNKQVVLFSIIFIIIYSITLTYSRIWWNTGTHSSKAKDKRCHMLKNPGCNVSLYRILDFQEAGWFYHSPFKSCRPFYAPGDSAVCSQNRDLPLTKEECEDICGETCILPDESKGVCMMEGSCKIDWPASSNPRPCGVYNVQCCPKSTKKIND